jgi:excisionase family DNA binding protein
VSELPEGPPGANPSVEGVAVVATTGMPGAPAITRSGPSPIARSATPAAAGPAPRHGRADLHARALRYHDDALLTVADAARLAGRSVRTLRRAYLSGRLIAHRDGNGRGVCIRCGDLRAWLTAEVIAPTRTAAPPRPIARANVRGDTAAGGPTGNTELLAVALQARRRRTRATADRRPAGRRAESGRR